MYKHDPSELSDNIKTEAKRLGFVLCGIIHPKPVLHYQDYLTWIQNKRGNGLDYLTNQSAIQARKNPLNIFSNCLSIISVAMPYRLITHSDTLLRIASFAHFQDYHVLISEKLSQLANFIQTRIGKRFSFKIGCDNISILEKMIAYQAGLGWIGKNGLLIHPTWGSKILLGELLVDINLPDQSNPLDEQCGDCNACILTCPSRCILDNRTIQANRCNSYQSIENRKIIPLEQRHFMANWIYGCDICQQVCPYNRKDPEVIPIDHLRLPFIEFLESANWISEFPSSICEEHLLASPLSRIKTAGLLRNSIVAIGNSRYSKYKDFVQQIRNVSIDKDIVELSNWAIEKIKP